MFVTRISMAQTQVVKLSARQNWQHHLKTTSRISQIKAETMVLHMDENIIALNKPPGLAVHEGPGLKQGQALASNMQLWQYDNDTPPALAHRIDKNTTGVVILSRNKSAAQNLAELFRNKKIIKKYIALCVGIPKHLEGTIRIPLGVKNVSTMYKKAPMHRVTLRQERQNDYEKFGVGSTAPDDVQLAVTNYRVICSLYRGNVASLIEVTPVTGFRHQIRVHLADGLLCPIIGDYKFAGPLFRQHTPLSHKMSVIGKTKGFMRGPMYLHAYEVEIPTPNGEKLTVRAPLPDYFIKTCKAIGIDKSKEFQYYIN